MEGESKMKRYLYILMLLAAALGMQSHSARAQDATTSWSWIYGNQDPRLTVTGWVVGGGASAAYWGLRRQTYTAPGGLTHKHVMTPLAAYAVTSVWCASAFPIIGTLVVNRPLTVREVYTGMASCVIPFIGGWMVEAAFKGQAWYEKK
jgi:hypothetical protein